MLITLPNPKALNNNNIFNCNLNTLKRFFPPEGFSNPKDTKYYNIGFYLKDSKDYIDKFNNDKIRDRYGISNLYYKMMEEDIGTGLEYLKPTRPVKAMIRYGYDDVVIHLQSSEVYQNYINELIERLLNYVLLSDKNLAFAKDELRRMRLSVTAMNKRLHKDAKYYEADAILELVKYFRFCLDEYQTYMEDKTQAANSIYFAILDNVSKDYLKLYHYIPYDLETYLRKARQDKNIIIL